MSAAAEPSHPPRRNLTLSDATSSARRAARALGNRRTFTQTQVARLISAAFRSGCAYGHELGTEEAVEHFTELQLAALGAAKDVPAYSAEEIQRAAAWQAHRAEWQAAAVLPREGDHPGGPASDWGYEPELVARVLTYNTWLAGQAPVPNPPGVRA
jgi:hypothetical protein